MGCGPVRGRREQEQQNQEDRGRGPGGAQPAARLRLRGYLIIFTGGGGDSFWLHVYRRSQRQAHQAAPIRKVAWECHYKARAIGCHQAAPPPSDLPMGDNHLG